MIKDISDAIEQAWEDDDYAALGRLGVKYFAEDKPKENVAFVDQETMFNLIMIATHALRRSVELTGMLSVGEEPN